MILRELVTRFRFDVDEKGVDKYNKSVGNMKLGLGKLVGGIGIGLLGKQLFDLGGKAEQAEFNLKRFAGTDFAPLRANFRRIQAEINGIRKGAGNVITVSDFDRATASFVQTMGRGKKELQSFNQLWEFSAKQSAITGENAADIVEQLTNAVSSGDFAIFQDKIPGFDLIKKQFEDFILEAKKVGDPGGVIDLNTRVAAFSRIIGEAGAEQDKAIKAIPDSLLKSREASKQLEDILQNLGKDIRDLLVPAIKKLSDILTGYNKSGVASVLQNILPIDKKSTLGSATSVSDMFFGPTDSSGRSEAVRSWDSLPSDLERIFSKPFFEFLKTIGIKPDPVGTPIANQGVSAISAINSVSPNNVVDVPPKARLYEEQKQGNTEININNTYQITNPDPKSVADQITKKQKEQINNAVNQVKKQER